MLKYDDRSGLTPLVYDGMQFQGKPLPELDRDLVSLINHTGDVVAYCPFEAHPYRPTSIFYCQAGQPPRAIASTDGSCGILQSDQVAQQTAAG